nr:hypothetical protein pmam_396 [Pithovirus mammoth]
MKSFFDGKFDLDNPFVKTSNLLLLGDPETGKEYLHENYVKSIRGNQNQHLLDYEEDSKYGELNSFTKGLHFGQDYIVRVHQISDPKISVIKQLVKSADGIFIFFESSNFSTLEGVSVWFNRVKRIRPEFNKISFVEMNIFGEGVGDDIVESLLIETRSQYPLFRISSFEFPKDAENLYRHFIENL